MKKLLILCIGLIAISNLYAQSLENLSILATVLPLQVSEEEPIPMYALQGKYAEFPGGEKALISYIQQNLEYPELARSHGHEGTVVVQYVIQSDGSVSQPKVIKTVGLGCDEAALAIFKKMPRWKPALQAGRTVAVKFTTPVKFSLF